MARAVLHGKGLEIDFWGEANNTACYIVKPILCKQFSYTSCTRVHKCCDWWWFYWVEDWDKLDYSSIDPIMVNEPKEKSFPEPPHPHKGLDTSNKESFTGTSSSFPSEPSSNKTSILLVKQSPSDKSKPPNDPSSRVKSNHRNVILLEI